MVEYKTTYKVVLGIKYKDAIIYTLESDSIFGTRELAEAELNRLTESINLSEPYAILGWLEENNECLDPNFFPFCG